MATRKEVVPNGASNVKRAKAAQARRGGRLELEKGTILLMPTVAEVETGVGYDELMINNDKDNTYWVLVLEKTTVGADNKLKGSGVFIKVPLSYFYDSILVTDKEGNPTTETNWNGEESDVIRPAGALALIAQEHERDTVHNLVLSMAKFCEDNKCRRIKVADFKDLTRLRWGADPGTDNCTQERRSYKWASMGPKNKEVQYTGASSDEPESEEGDEDEV